MESAHGSSLHNMINLAYKDTCMPCSETPKDEGKEYYPTLYIRSKNKIDLPSGEFQFKAVGKKVAYSERDGEYTCEIEVKGIEPQKGKAEKKKEEIDDMMDDSDDIIEGVEAELTKVTTNKYPANAEDVETS
jgi:hypothetical protein